MSTILRNVSGVKGLLSQRVDGKLLVLLVLSVMGCTRASYHRAADRDTYYALRDRQNDWRWQLPPRPVEANPQSRMADPTNPDATPIPPDEPNARRYQVSASFPLEFHGWKKRGTAPVEDLSWLHTIPTEPDGSILLSRDSVMQLGLMNSRDYQYSLEGLYLVALDLTLAEFQFMTHGFSTNTLFYQHAGGIRNPSDQLQLGTSDGFNREFMTGAQLLVDLANSLVFEYSGKRFQMASPSLAIAFSQPLLRGAWARIATQDLSLQERGVLYAVRTFAQYRRTFYVNLVASNGYLGFLATLQTIRNTESNLKSLRRSLDEYEAQFKAGMRTLLERDQIAQQYQQTQFGLLQSQAGLQYSLDQFKVNLGLPPTLQVKLDDSPLKLFELNNPKLDELRTRNEELYLRLFQQDVMPAAEQSEIMQKLQAEYAELDQIYPEVATELRRWQAKIKVLKQQRISWLDVKEQNDLVASQEQTAKDVASSLEEFQQNRAKDRDDLAAFQSQIKVAATDQALGDCLKSLRKLVGNAVRARLSEIFVAQNETRVFLIELTPVDLTQDQAIEIALCNRLDLKNDLARVTDAWRSIEVTANSLRGFLNFNYSANLASAPNHDTLYRFDASNSTQRFGLEFDAPINRRAERNAYRTAQITYQRARRQYMLTHDNILLQIREDLRLLNLYRHQFEIGRAQILTASRQFESADYDVRFETSSEKPVTLNLLTALSNILNARNNLISTWVSYENTRMSLFRDFDIMNIDANGIWTNEHDKISAPGPNDTAAAGTAAAVSPDAPGGSAPAGPPSPPATPGPFAPPQPRT